jgi:uncharacterized protein YdhG (YjbR/CyaY superfamily)
MRYRATADKAPNSTRKAAAIGRRSLGEPMLQAGNEMMPANRARPKSIAEYIRRSPKKAQKKLREMRACIRAAAPGAKQSLKWGMPAFSYGRILLTFAVFEHHISFYPTPSAVRAFAKDLSRLVTASASIQCPLEEPLPLSLIGKITRFRVREYLEEDKRWRT